MVRLSALRAIMDLLLVFGVGVFKQDQNELNRTKKRSKRAAFRGAPGGDGGGGGGSSAPTSRPATPLASASAHALDTDPGQLRTPTNRFRGMSPSILYSLSAH